MKKIIAKVYSAEDVEFYNRVCTIRQYSTIKTPVSILEQDPYAHEKQNVRNYWSPLAVRTRQSQWAMRCQQEILGLMRLRKTASAEDCALTPESPYHAWFLTLTYDDDHLPLFNDGTQDWGNIDPQHATDLMRHMRHWVSKDGSRVSPAYMGCYEYGENTHRPHIHLVLIGASWNYVVHLTEHWRKLFCPKSLKFQEPLSTVDPNDLDLIEGHLIGIDVRHIGDKDGNISVDDAAKIGTYVGKYAAKGNDTWYRKIYNAQKDYFLKYILPENPHAEFKHLHRPFLIRPSRYFGMGCTLWLSPADAAENAKQFIEDLGSSLLSVPIAPTDGKGHWNDRYLAAVQENTCIVDSNDFKHKIPEVWLKKVFVKDTITYYEYINKVNNETLLYESVRVKRTYTIQHPLGERLESTTKIPCTIPLPYALALYGKKGYLLLLDMYRAIYNEISADYPDESLGYLGDLSDFVNTQLQCEFAERICNDSSVSSEFYGRCTF